MRPGIIIAATIAALSSGVAAAGTQHLTAAATYQRVSHCAENLGAIQVRQDGNLGGEAWFGHTGHSEQFTTGHFEWGYIEGEYGRVLNLIIVEDQGQVPLGRLLRCWNDESRPHH